jgi:hypothetical protein
VYDVLAKHTAERTLHRSIDRTARLSWPTWPERIGKGLMFISLNVEQNTREAAMAAPDAPTACSGHRFLASGIIVPAMQF